MDELAGLAVISGFFTFVIGLILLIVFFVMASNIGAIKRLAQKQVKQNDEIIKLLKVNIQPDKLEEIEQSNEPIVNRQPPPWA